MTAPRHSREPNAGYVAAAAVLVLSGAGIVTLGIVAGVSNGLTDREWVAGFIAFTTALIAALWLYRYLRLRGRGRQ